MVSRSNGSATDAKVFEFSKFQIHANTPAPVYSIRASKSPCTNNVPMFHRISLLGAKVLHIVKKQIQWKCYTPMTCQMSKNHPLVWYLRDLGTMTVHRRYILSTQKSDYCKGLVYWRSSTPPLLRKRVFDSPPLFFSCLGCKSTGHISNSGCSSL